MAALLYKKNVKWSVLKLPPGEGKTFTIILLAMLMNEKDSINEFVFLSQNDALVRQFKHVIAFHDHAFDGMTIHCVKADNFDGLLALYESAAYFVDEGDHLIKHQMCRVLPVSYRLSGLV